MRREMNHPNQEPGGGSRLTTHDSRLTIHDSRLTTHDSRPPERVIPCTGFGSTAEMYTGVVLFCRSQCVRRARCLVPINHFHCMCAVKLHLQWSVKVKATPSLDLAWFLFCLLACQSCSRRAISIVLVLERIGIGACMLRCSNADLIPGLA